MPKWLKNQASGIKLMFLIIHRRFLISKEIKFGEEEKITKHEQPYSAQFIYNLGNASNFRILDKFLKKS